MNQSSTSGIPPTENPEWKSTMAEFGDLAEALQDVVRDAESDPTQSAAEQSSRRRGRPASTDLERSAERFLTVHGDARNLSPATVEFYRKELRVFLSFARANGIRTPRGITEEVVEQYFHHVRRMKKADGTTVSAHTAHKAQRVFRMFTKWLRRRRLIAEDFGRAVDMVRFRESDSIQYVTEDELERILAIPNRRRNEGLRDYLICYILAATGLRLGELLGLRRCDVLEKEHRLRVRAETSKSKRERLVPLPEQEVGGKRVIAPELATPLTRHLIIRSQYGMGEQDPVFAAAGYGNKPLSRYTVAAAMKRIGRKAGRPDLSPHKLRHTAAVMLLKKTRDIMLVKDILGHSTLEVTRRYLRFTPDDVQERYREANHMAAVSVPTRRAPRRPNPKELDRLLKERGVTIEKIAEALFER